MLNMPVRSAAFAMSLILGSVFAGEGIGSAAAAPRAAGSAPEGMERPKF